MNIEVEKTNGWTVCRLEGALDSGSAGRTQAELLKTLEPRGGSFLVDLEKVDSVDSSGLAALVRFYKEIRTRGGTMALCAVSCEAMRMFQVTRLDTIFTILSDSSDTASSDTARAA